MNNKHLEGGAGEAHSAPSHEDTPDGSELIADTGTRKETVAVIDSVTSKLDEIEGLRETLRSWISPADHGGATLLRDEVLEHMKDKGVREAIFAFHWSDEASKLNETASTLVLLDLAEAFISRCEDSSRHLDLLETHLDLERLHRVKELEGKPAKQIHLFSMTGNARVRSLIQGYFLRFEASDSDQFKGGLFVDKETGEARFHEAENLMMSRLKDAGTAAEVADKILDWLEA
jgi:hypothetical protein